jgi:hypothetical protein
MAPLPPVGRARAIALVEKGSLPVQLGSPHPTVMIVEQDAVFRIRDLVIDPDEADAARDAAFAQRKPWMPEHHYALGKPTGAIHVEAATRDELLVAMRTMDWPSYW